MSEKPVILAVDDDAPTLHLMRTMLLGFGFEPVTAPSGEQALDEVSRRVPDLVLVDRNMPRMSGTELIAALRKMESFRGTPIVVLSGEPMSDAEVSTIGANAAVLKPFDVTGLIDLVRKLIAGN